jgi:SAM-dependent methyltransferase
MTDDRTAMLSFEMYRRLPRQGPGDSASTLKALALVPGIGPGTRVLDLGCGTGAQTLVLAQNTPARFVAIDTHAPFVDELSLRARVLGLADRVEARVGDMGRLDFAAGSFDVVWCEGAIYNMGVEAALNDWRRLLAPRGHIAMTEVCWTKPDPPPDCAAFWAREYPAIRDEPALLRIIENCGYETVGHFVLPSSSWWDDYYGPLQHEVTQLRERYPGEADALELADQFQREIDMWHAHSPFYSYAFFVMRAR